MPTPRTEFTPAHAATLRASVAEHGQVPLEEALVRAHLARAGFTGPGPRDLTRIVDGTGPAALAADEVVREVPVESVDDLVRAFEVLSTGAGDEGAGVVFTPAWVADALAAETLTVARRGERVVDPSLGCGALLVAALRRIHALHGGTRPAGQIISEQLFGCDVDAGSVRRARLLLLVVAATDLGETSADIPDRLRVADALDRDGWGPDRFGVVLGNPPYVRFQELTVAHRDRYRANWQVLAKGNFNLYFAFYELAHHLRSPGGAVAFIAPSGYLRSASAKPLREWMVRERFPTRIVDFGDTQLFPTALTYVAITVSDHAATAGGVRFAVADGPASFAKLDPAGEAFTPFADLTGGPWPLVPLEHQAAVAAIRSRGPALSDVVDIRFGAATLRDKLFLLDGHGRTRTGEQLEPGASVPAVKVSGVADQAALDACSTRILFPYTRDADGTARVWTEEELDQFPATRAYLTLIRAELARRDLGRKEYAAWFAYGRTQGLAMPVTPRLLSPLYGARPRFLLDSTPGRVFLNGISLTPRTDSDVSVELLAAVLNSELLRYFIEQTSTPISGGYFSYQKGPLSRFHLPEDVITSGPSLLAATPAEREALLADLYRVDLPTTR